LNWLLDGWRLYMQVGLVDPQTVQVATKDYKGDSDPMGEWLSSCCVIGPDEELPAKDGFESFSQWQIDTKVAEKYRWTQTKFGKELAERFKKTIPTTGPHRKKTVYQGIRLQTEEEKAEETEVKDDLPTVAYSSGVSALEHAFLGGNGLTLGNHGQSGVSPSLEEINAELNGDADGVLF
jgi:phage/plasmid-associated DNA primase